MLHRCCLGLCGLERSPQLSRLVPGQYFSGRAARKSMGASGYDAADDSGGGAAPSEAGLINVPLWN